MNHAPRRPAVPGGLLAMLGMVAGVEAYIARRDLDFSTVWAQDWRSGGAAARVEAPGCAVLCFGDSLLKYGLIPSVLEARTGGRAYNMAMHAGKAPGSYFLLQRALESGARPRAVVVDFDAAHLAIGPLDLARQWPEMLTWRDCLDLSVEMRDASLFGQLALAKLLPSLRARHEIREALYALYRRRRERPRYEILVHLRNWSLNRGAQVVPKNSKPPSEVDRARRLPPLPPWECDPTNAAYVERFLSLAQSRGIPVYWLIAPCKGWVQSERERIGYEQPYNVYIKRLIDRYPNLVLLDARHSGYPERVFDDITHLDREGAVALSASVGDVLRAGPGRGAGGPRWLELPPYLDRPSDGAIEDVEQSRIALRQALGRRGR
jgi:hypothetical protein